MLSNEHMMKFVQDNPDLVTCKKQLNGLNVLKYKNKVFFKNLWTPELLECRGTVVDDEFNVIQRPFTKIFNYGENGTRIERGEIVTAPCKINGFMGALTWHNGAPLVSTTGSCDSEFADMAYQMLAKTNAFKMAEFYHNVTFIFEIVHPDDPHIVPETIGVYLLGCRRTKWDASQHMFSESTMDSIADEYGLMRPEWYRMRFGDLVQMAKHVDHEGFVCWTRSGYELKIKSPKYLVSKFLARINVNKFTTAIEKDPESLKQRVDEEYYPLIDHVVTMGSAFAELPEQERLELIRGYFYNGT